METIKEFGGAIEENDPSSFANSSIRDYNPDHPSDNQSSLTTTCGIGQAECLDPSSFPSYCSPEPENECLSDKKFRKLINKFKFTMLLQYSKEFLGFIAIILTTYATLLNKEPVIGGTRSPKPIFSLHSIIQEWPHGNLIDLQSKVAVTDLSLIYFYAPWCAESLLAKKVYNSIANLYNEEVYFAAVNCWQPNSGCRTLYSSVYKWPVLMAYLPNTLSVQYKGDWNFHSLSKFIDGLLIPIVRIHNKTELTRLRILNDGVVFGLFKSCDTKEYQTFFQSSIKWLEHDPYKSTKFAVYVGEETSMFQLSEEHQVPVIKLFTPNDTIIYKQNTWTSKNIINFLKEKLVESFIWLSLPSIKSTTIQKYLQNGPALVMFSPRVSQSYFYLIMRQLMYSYNNYNIDLNNSILNDYISEMKLEFRFEKFARSCEKSPSIRTHSYFFDVRRWGSSLCYKDTATVNTSKQIPHERIEVPNKINNKYCEEHFYQNNCFEQKIESLDYRAPSEILLRHIQKRCMIIEKLPKQFFQRDVIEPIINFKLPNDYKNNRTLKFLILDSMVHNEYLRNFMGDIRMQQIVSFPQSKLFIVDNDRETLHMLRKTLSTKTAFEFVSDFYHGKLTRHFRSFEQMENKNYSSDSLLISIKEINSQQFSKIKNTKNVTFIVLFYSPHCPLCYVMSQALLQVSLMFDTKNVKFYRIDAGANELCWEYTMDKLPKLIVFPKNRAVDSNVFLSTVQINVKNVFSFVLSNLSPELQIHALINACILTKLTYAFHKCMEHVGGQINNEISSQLQWWHHHSSNRTQILIRLNFLKELYMDLLNARKDEDLKFISVKVLKYGRE